MNRTDEIIEQAHHLTREGLNLGQIRDVLKAARSLHAIFERQCNGYADTDWGRAKEQLDQERETRIVATLKETLPNKVTIQGDPRGAPIIVNENSAGEFRVWG